MATQIVNSPTYLKSIGDPIDETDRNQCAVIATTVASGRSYSSVRNEYRQRGRMKGKGTLSSTIRNVLYKYGFRRLQEYNPYYAKENPTVLEFAKKYATGTYVLLVRGHALTVIDGEIYDNMTTKRARIWEAWKMS